MLANLAHRVSRQVYFIANINIINRSFVNLPACSLLIFALFAGLFCTDFYPVPTAVLPTPTDTLDVTSEILTAEFEANNNHPAEALAIYQKLALQTKNIDLAKRATELSIELGHDEEAMKTALIWADGDKNSIKAQIIATLLIAQYNSIPEIYSYLKQLVVLATPDTFINIELLLNHQLENQKMKELGTLLTRIHQELPKNAAVNLALALYDEKNNNSKMALSYTNSALQIAPEWEQAHMQKTKLLSLHESSQAALAYLNKIVNKYPKLYELQKLYADILYDLEKWNEAETYYTKLSQNDKFKDEALFQLVHISVSKNNLKDAEKYLLELDQNPDYESVSKYYLGLIAQQSGDYTKALNYYKEANEGEYSIRAKVRAAAILNNLNQASKAKDMLLSVYNISEQSNDEIKDFVLTETQLLYEQGLNKEAYAILKTLEEKLPGDLDVTYSIGIVAKKLNNLELFEKNMGTVLNKNPNNVNALSALGWYYFNNKNNDKALTMLRQAFENDDTSSPNIGARLGAVLWTVGQRNEANEIWKKMLELDPYNEGLQDIIKKYKNN